MSALAVPFVLCLALFFCNAVVWLLRGFPWAAVGWLAAMPVLYVIQRWILK